jgi:WhiB family redox-sensing transcriptional regulator
MNATPTTDDSWMTEGECYRSSNSVFFDDPVQAKAICDTCAVQDLCLGYALTMHEKDGMWGGATERQRRRMRRTWLWRVCKWRKCRRLFEKGDDTTNFFCSLDCRDARVNEQAEEQKERQQRWRDA